MAVPYPAKSLPKRFRREKKTPIRKISVSRQMRSAKQGCPKSTFQAPKMFDTCLKNNPKIAPNFR